MWPNPQFLPDLVTFTEEILNGKLHFLCSDICKLLYQVRFLTVVPPFGPFWSVKYLNFGQKLLIWTAHYTFLESRHPEATKNPYVLFPEGSQKRYQLMNHYHHFFEQQRRNDTLNLLTPWYHTTLLRCRK